MHKKFKVFQDCIDELKGQPATPEWAQATLQKLVAAGASDQDLREISEQIKRGLTLQ